MAILLQRSTDFIQEVLFREVIKNVLCFWSLGNCFVLTEIATLFQFYDKSSEESRVKGQPQDNLSLYLFTSTAHI